MSKAQFRSNQLYWVRDNLIAGDFPPINAALKEPDGLLAIGADLSPERLLDAYRRGIFPWYNEGQPVLWWSPDPRWVLEPAEIKISRSLHKTLKRKTFHVTYDTHFRKVMELCAAPRKETDATWITTDIMHGFNLLHRQGDAHSVECWSDGHLAGGLYGIAIGRVFFGESMFSRKSDASKVALVSLARQLQAWDFRIIDCQIHSRHLESLGARAMTRNRFAALLKQFCTPHIHHNWRELNVA
jgi:leucyl/phenylalanyl-tRNA--protein transferase